MAREKIDKSYSFYPVEILKGSVDDGEIDAFINTTERLMLKKNSGDVVVLRLESGKAGWLYTTYADAVYQEFIRAIIEQSLSWDEFRGDRKRIDFFATYLSHRNRLIREQAYLEVGRAPYASIKQIAGTVPRRQIRAFLEELQFIEWHSLYILLLGQSRHPDDMAYIRQKIETAAAYALNKNLSAWVTAFIETNPETGLEEIEDLFFSNKHRTPNKGELEEIWMGLSVLGSEGGSLTAPEIFERRQRIVQSYGTLLDNHPLMAGSVARDLTIWQLRALVERLTEIKENEPALEPDARMAVTYYLSISQKF